MLYTTVPAWRPTISCTDMSNNVYSVYTVGMHGHHLLSAEYGPTRYGCQSCSLSAEHENEYFPVSVLASENLARRVRPYRPQSLLMFYTQAESGAYSRHSSCFLRRRPHVRPTTISPSLSSHANAYRWRTLPRVCRYKASSSQGSSNNECCLFICHHEPTFVCLTFPTSTAGV